MLYIGSARITRVCVLEMQPSRAQEVFSRCQASIIAENWTEELELKVFQHTEVSIGLSIIAFPFLSVVLQHPHLPQLSAAPNPPRSHAAPPLRKSCDVTGS